MYKMIRVLIISFIMFSYSGFSQSTRKVFYDTHVECYFDNKALDSLVIYDSIDGKAIKSLKIDEQWQRNLWYKIAIQETKDGWAKVENIMVAPGRNDSINSTLSFHNKWVKTKYLKINTKGSSSPYSHGILFYLKADTASRVILKTGSFLELNLIETKGLWAKVSFVLDERKYTGWLERNNQCAYPWTICP